MTTDNTPTGSPAMRDERAAFEAWRRRTTKALNSFRSIARNGFGDDAPYVDKTSNGLWAAWQARAAIAARSPEPAPVALSDSMDCEDCGGTGEVGDEIYQGEFQPPEREKCSSCDGSGRWRIASKPVAPAEPVTDAQIMEITREFAKDGGRWPSDWINAARAVLALRQPAESTKDGDAS